MKMLYVVTSVEVVVDKDLPVAFDLIQDRDSLLFLQASKLSSKAFQINLNIGSIMLETRESPPGNTTRFIHFNCGENRSLVERSDTALVRLSVN